MLKKHLSLRGVRQVVARAFDYMSTTHICMSCDTANKIGPRRKTERFADPGAENQPKPMIFNLGSQMRQRSPALSQDLLLGIIQETPPRSQLAPGSLASDRGAPPSLHRTGAILIRNGASVCFPTLSVRPSTPGQQCWLWDILASSHRQARCRLSPRSSRDLCCGETATTETRRERTARP
jgi:hypothetical protein